jgi:tetratricopeptide (TPR) repeat protein
LPEAEVLQVGCATCEGLAAAHAQGVVHRDIKVDNILLPWAVPGRDVNLRGAKLADLGLGRSQEQGQTLTGTQATLGTPGYMAPEQASDARRAGPPADVFSLGATLYALLTGQAPFVGSSAFDVLLATAQKPHAPLHEFRPDVSAPTAAVIDRCLQKVPEQRYRDAMELLGALRGCAGRDSTAVGQADAPTMVPQPAPLTPTPVQAVPHTPPAAPLTPAGAVASSAPTPVAPVAAPAARHGRGRLWLLGTALTIIVLAAAACGGWFYTQAEFDAHVSRARDALEQENWATVKSECLDALRFSILKDTTEIQRLQAHAEAGMRFDEEMASAGNHVQSKNWQAAEGAYLRALAITGFSKDRDARKGLEKVRLQLSYDDKMSRARARGAAEDWNEALKYYEEALRVPGFESDAEAEAGRLRARQALAYGEALARARAAVVVGSWEEALKAVGEAQAVPGYEQDAAVRMLQGQARNGLSFEQANAGARRLLEQGQFEQAATSFEEAAGLARQPNSPILTEEMATAQNGKTFSSLLGGAKSLLKEERWTEALADLKTADTLHGFEAHRATVELMAEARRGIEFTRHLADGQRNLENKTWSDALSAFQSALKIEGFADDARASEGARKAQLGVDFTKAFEEASRETRAGAWARAQAAYKRALAVEGFENHREAKAGLQEVSSQLVLLGKKQAYTKALAEVRRLRKAVPPGPREQPAWSAVRQAAQAAIDTGHDDVSEARALHDEAVRAEKAAKGWLDSDGKLVDARRLAKQGDWEGASQMLEQALALAPRTDTAELQATITKGLAQAQGRSFWEGDRRYLEYKGRRWLIGVRGKPLEKDPFIGAVRLKPGTGPTLLWVRVAEKSFWFIRDVTNDVGVGFQMIRNEHTSNAAKTERTEWVGPYAFKDGKWTIQIKMYRQYDKQNGGSGSLYPNSSKSEMSVKPDGTVYYDPRLFKSHPMERVSYEVPDDIARQVIDAYLAKWSGEE